MASQYRHASGPDSQDTIPDEDRHACASVENMDPSMPDSGPEIDSNSDDDDSTLRGLSQGSDTNSLGRRGRNSVEGSGRTYHNYHDGNGKLHIAPFSTPPQRVLDIGCGTGIWAIEFAQQYPSAQVTGIDLSPIQPETVPSNCHFEIRDVEDVWEFGEAFDYIHGRALMNCFKDISTVFASAFKSLAPGGYFEMQDGCMPFRSADGTLDNTTLLDWCHKTLEGSSKVGRTWADPRNYKRIMEDVGFVGVTETRLMWPLNTWPKDPKLKELGMWVRDDMMEILPAVKKVFTMGLGWSIVDADSFVQKAKVDLINRDIHGWIDIVVVHGRKPTIS